MANINSTELTFTAASHLYQLTPNASKIDAHDQLSARIAQLSAMLLQITNEGGHERFKSMNDTVQQNYLWAMLMAVDECRDLLAVI